MAMLLLAACHSSDALNGVHAGAAKRAGHDHTAPLPLPLPVIMAAADAAEENPPVTRLAHAGADVGATEHGGGVIHDAAHDDTGAGMREDDRNRMLEEFRIALADIHVNDIGGGDMPPVDMPPDGILSDPPMQSSFIFEYMLAMTCTSILPCPVDMLTGSATLEIDTDARKLNLRDIDLSSSDTEFHMDGMFSVALHGPDDPPPIPGEYETGNFDGSLTGKTDMREILLAQDVALHYGGFDHDTLAVKASEIRITLHTPDYFFTFIAEGCPDAGCAPGSAP